MVVPKMPKNFNAKNTIEGEGDKKAIGLTEAMERFIRYCNIKNLKETTVYNYKSHTKVFYDVAVSEKMPIENVRELKTQHAKLYQLRLLERGLSFNTINTYILAMNIFWDFLVKKKYVESNIFKDMHIKTQKTYKYTPNEEEWKKMFNYQLKKADASFVQFRNLCLFVFLSDTGARINETLSVKRRDIHLEEKGKEYVLLDNTKNGEYRKVGLSNRLINLLKSYMEITKEVKCEYLFISKRGQQWSKRASQHAIYELGAGSGVSQVSCHALRRYFIYKHVNKGTPLPILQRLVGHKDVAMVSHYYTMFSEDFLKYKNIDD